MSAEIDKRLEDRGLVAKVLLKQFVTARGETEKRDDEDRGRNAVVAVAAVDEEAGNC